MIKITIEGWKDEPVVLEDVEQFLVITKKEKGVIRCGKTNPMFLSYCAKITDLEALAAIDSARNVLEKTEVW